MQWHVLQMRTDDREFDRFHLSLLIERGCRGQSCRRAIIFGRFEQTRIASGRPDQCDPEARTVVALARRYRDGGHVEQVHEVGVEPEVAVKRDGFGKQFGNAIDGAGGREGEHIDSLPHRLRFPLQRGQLVMAFECCDRGNFRAWFDHLADGRIDRVGVTFQQVPQGSRPFGNPGTIVEQRRGFLQIADVEFDERGPFGQHCERLFVEPLRCCIAEPVALPGHGHADTMRLQQPLGQRARVGIIGIETRDDAIDQPGIGRVVRKHADAIERATGRHQSARAPAALARFVADQMVERRRDPPRPRRVCAQREGNKSRCNRDRRSRTRATADIGAVIGVGGNAEGAARADEAGGELVEIGLAHAQGPGGFELRHDICRMSRSIGKGRAAGGGFEPVDVDIVLHREGNAR